MLTFVNTELPKELSHFKERDLKWLWQQMLNNGFILPTENTVAKSNKASFLANVLMSNATPHAWISQFSQMHQNTILPQEQLSWIDKKDVRFLIWLEWQINTLLLQPINQSPQQERYSHIIFSIDIWQDLAANKLAFLSQKQIEWSNIKTPNSMTKWVIPKDGVQLEWCWNYLLKNYKAIAVQQPTNLHEFHVAILASLDNMSYGHIDSKRLFLDKMKKTWAQKKYRDSGKAKKQYSLPMDEYVREQLHAISKQKDERVHETLERLIKEEYKKTQQNF